MSAFPRSCIFDWKMTCLLKWGRKGVSFGELPSKDLPYPRRLTPLARSEKKEMYILQVRGMKEKKNRKNKKKMGNFKPKFGEET